MGQAEKPENLETLLVRSTPGRSSADVLTFTECSNPHSDRKYGLLILQ